MEHSLSIAVRSCDVGRVNFIHFPHSNDLPLDLEHSVLLKYDLALTTQVIKFAIVI